MVEEVKTKVVKKESKDKVNSVVNGIEIIPEDLSDAVEKVSVCVCVKE